MIAYDLRGSGQSEVTPGPYTIDLLADDLRALVEALELGRCRARRRTRWAGRSRSRTRPGIPGDVRALVGIGAPAEFPDQARAGLAARAETVESEGMAAVAETVATNGVSPTFREGRPEEFREFAALLAGQRSRAATRRSAARSSGSTSSTGCPPITAPVLLLSGDRDGVSPPAATEANAGRVAGRPLRDRRGLRAHHDLGAAGRAGGSRVAVPAGAPVTGAAAPRIAPWLSLRGGAEAVAYYEAAFGAVVLHRHANEAGEVVAQLSVGGAEFWVADDPALSPETLGGGSARFILCVDDPDALFAQAVAAGARSSQRCTRATAGASGACCDPFGHHWEIARQLDRLGRDGACAAGAADATIRA